MRRLWGQPYGNRARLDIVQHAGTPQEVRRIESIDLTQGKTVKVALKNGRRTELAVVSPANQVKRQQTVKEGRATDPWVKLRRLAFPDFAGARRVDGGVGSPGAAQRRCSWPGRGAARRRRSTRRRSCKAPCAARA